MDKTDYKPGDEPVPVGTWVFYQGSLNPGVYQVIGHMDPELRPDRGALTGFTNAEIYPDGTGYELWPVGVARKFGLRHLGVLWARRTSFRSDFTAVAEEIRSRYGLAQDVTEEALQHFFDNYTPKD